MPVGTVEVRKAEGLDAEGCWCFFTGLGINGVVRGEFAGGGDAGIDEEAAIFGAVITKEG